MLLSIQENSIFCAQAHKRTSLKSRLGNYLNASRTSEARMYRRVVSLFAWSDIDTPILMRYTLMISLCVNLIRLVLIWNSGAKNFKKNPDTSITLTKL
jgi:hypothetical protein